MRRALALLAIVFFGAACGTAPVQVTHVKLAGLAGRAASFDVVEIDQQHQRLYAADRTDGGVDVFDTSRVPAAFVTTVTMPSDPNGIAVAPELDRAFAGLSDGSIAVIDTKTESLLKDVPTGATTIDLIEYAAATHTVYGSTAIGSTITRVDAVTGAIAGPAIKVGFPLEQPRYNPADGMLYATSPGADAVFRIDPIAGSVKDKLPVTGCSPKGMAINPKQDQALIACASWVMRMSLRNPADQKGFTQVGGGDIVSYDSRVDRFLVASPQGPKRSEVALFGGDPIDYITAVETGGMGNSAAYDEKNGVVYSPDVMPGLSGLDAFKAPAGEFVFSISNSAVAVFATLLAAAVVLMFVVGRLADPARKPAPVAAAAPLAVAAEGIRPRARKWVRPDPTE